MILTHLILFGFFAGASEVTDVAPDSVVQDIIAIDRGPFQDIIVIDDMVDQVAQDILRLGGSIQDKINITRK